jgi:hypothetical protein
MPVEVRARVDSGIGQVAEHLVAEFDGVVPAHIVRRVMRAARSDLDNEVPAEALPEFLHRLTRQRLIDLDAGVPEIGPATAGDPASRMERSA